MRRNNLLGRATLWGLFLILLLVSAGISPLFAADKPDLTLLVKGNTDFAFALYSQLAQDKGNLFFSPFSISSALAMTYAGARGETAKQMAEVLHFAQAGADLHPAFSQLTARLNAGGKNYQLSVANALWGQAGFKFRPEFLDINNRYYGAGFKPVDYIKDANREKTRQTINRWVEKKTQNKIKELIKPDILTALTRLVLTNAIYFKGQWQTQFKAADTKPMPFYISNTEKTAPPTMSLLKTKFNYAENDQAQILEMPYKGGDISMVILLPRAEVGLTKLEGDLQAEKIQSWLARLSSTKVDVYLPRFKLEKDVSLNEKLKSLGMTDAFDAAKADFSGMAPGNQLYITSVIHKAFVEVNEEGTEAAAATAVVVGLKSAAPDRPVVFRADHPFIFLIRDNRSGGILFMGRLVDPR